MGKNNKHILLAVLSFSLILVSCKGTKEAKAGPDKTAESPRIKVLGDQSRFDSKYVDGCAARMKGNLEEALNLFNECKKIDPANVAVKYELATIYKLLGVNDQALLNAKACAEADQKNEWYQLILIECYNSLKQYNQSVKLRENLVKNFPARSDFKEDLAIVYSVLGQYDKAFKIYELLEKEFGVNEQISLNKVKLLKGQKKFKEAEAELKRLSGSDTLETRYYSYLADFYIERNQLEDARKMYDKILQVDPNNPVVNLALHDYYSGQGKMAEAFDYLRKAFLNPDLDASIKGNILSSFYSRIDGPSGTMYKENGMDLAQIMIQVHPQSAESNALYADFLMLDKKYKEASGYLHKAALSDKNNYRVWNQLLLTYAKLNQFDSLEHTSATAMELFPSQAKAYFFNGISNMQLKNYKKASQSLKDGLEFVADDKLLMLDFYSNLGDAYNYNKEFEKSDKAFDDGLKIDADNTYILNNYAYYLSLRKENFEKAEKLSKKANDLKPDVPEYMDTYGWILYQQKKYKEAEEWLARAAKFKPKANILEHYGDLLYRLNKPAEALKQWENAKLAGGNSDLLLKKIKDKKLDD